MGLKHIKDHPSGRRGRTGDLKTITGLIHIRSERTIRKQQEGGWATVCCRGRHDCRTGPRSLPLPNCSPLHGQH